MTLPSLAVTVEVYFTKLLAGEDLPVADRQSCCHSARSCHPVSVHVCECRYDRSELMRGMCQEERETLRSKGGKDGGSVGGDYTMCVCRDGTQNDNFNVSCLLISGEVIIR